MNDIVFPRTRGAVGETLGRRVNPDFDGIEYAGWATKPPKLMYTADPAGSPLTVVRFQIDLGDECLDQYGPDGQRIELWKEDSAQQQGDSCWQAFSWYVGDGVAAPKFVMPDGWALMWQNHGIGEQGSPAQALLVQGGRWVFSRRLSGSDLWADQQVDIAPITLGRWHHFLMYFKFSTGNDGVARVWHSTDKQPLPTDQAKVDISAPTLLGKPTRPNLHMYRKPSTSPSQYPWVAYSSGFGRAQTAVAALKAAWPVAAPSAPDVPAAIAHITKTLEWLRRPKPGGMGYSESKVKQSNAYAALVDLGGRWP